MDKLVKTLMQRWYDEKSASFVTNALVKLQEPLSKCLKNWIMMRLREMLSLVIIVICLIKERAMTYSGVLLKFDWIMKEPAMVLKSLKLKK